MLKITELNGRYVGIEKWEYHKRGKNYVSLITGKHPKYKFDRVFLDHTKIDGKVYFDKEDLDPGEIYEVRCIYFSGGGNPDYKVNGLFKWTGEGFSPMTEAEVLQELNTPQEERNPLEGFTNEQILQEAIDRGLVFGNVEK